MNRTTRKQILTLTGSILFAFIIIFIVREIKLSITGRPADTSEAGSKVSMSSTDTPASQTSDTTTDNTEETSSDEVETTTKPVSNYTPIRLSFGGNLMIKSDLIDRVSSNNAISKGLLNHIRKADLSIISLQTPIADTSDIPVNNTSENHTDTSNSGVISKLGFNCVSLANNYIMECGSQALNSTVNLLDSNDILHTGAGENLTVAQTPVIKEIQGKKICIISTCRNISNSEWIATDNNSGIFSSRETDAVIDSIRKYSGECDIVVVYMNAGDEMSEELDIYQQHLSHQFVDAGAGLVVGAFPQKVQGIEYYKNTPIIYSLGNFINGTDSADSMVLSVDIAEDNSLKCTITPCTSSIATIQGMNDEKKPDFYSHINELSEELNTKISDDGLITPIE